MDEQLRDALSKPFGREAIRQKRGQGGRTMDYVSHGMVTKRLNDIAPDWSAEMIERYVQDIDGKLHCLGGVMRMTIGGVTHEEAGGPARLTSLADDLKNTYSDCLKRCAMRFGVALDLWESAEENDEDAEPVQQTAPSRPARQDAPQIVTYKQTGEHLDKQGFRYQPRKDGAAELAARQAPATSAPTDDWTAFWSWARARGITGCDMLDAAAGCTTQGKLPTEIRALIEAHDTAPATT